MKRHRLSSTFACTTVLCAVLAGCSERNSGREEASKEYGHMIAGYCSTDTSDAEASIVRYMEAIKALNRRGATGVDYDAAIGIAQARLLSLYALTDPEQAQRLLPSVSRTLNQQRLSGGLDPIEFDIPSVQREVEWLDEDLDVGWRPSGRRIRKSDETASGEGFQKPD